MPSVSVPRVGKGVSQRLESNQNQLIRSRNLQHMAQIAPATNPTPAPMPLIDLFATSSRNTSTASGVRAGNFRSVLSRLRASRTSARMSGLRKSLSRPSRTAWRHSAAGPDRRAAACRRMTQSKTARVTTVGTAGRAYPAKQVLGLSHCGLRRDSLPWGFLGAASFSSPSAIHVRSVKAKKSGKDSHRATGRFLVGPWSRRP
jgi:hypothetical protein